MNMNTSPCSRDYTFLCLGIALCVSCSEPPPPKPPVRTEAVSRAELGSEWPLTVDEGRVGCVPPLGTFFEVPGGTRYALAQNAGYGFVLSIDRIQERQPKRADGLNSPLKNLSALQLRAVRLCVP